MGLTVENNLFIMISSSLSNVRVVGENLRPERRALGRPVPLPCFLKAARRSGSMPEEPAGGKNDGQADTRGNNKKQ